MVVKEVVRLQDGRDIVINLSEEENNYLLSYAINNLIKDGALTIGNAEERIGTAVDASDVVKGLSS